MKNKNKNKNKIKKKEGRTNLLCLLLYRNNPRD
jgi:hypothetical protein